MRFIYGKSTTNHSLARLKYVKENVCKEKPMDNDEKRAEVLKFTSDILNTVFTLPALHT